jgi:hypothetical protein
MGEEAPMPQVISCQLAALTIASLFYVWRDLLHRRLTHSKLLRERVTYMLWVTAQR